MGGTPGDLVDELAAGGLGQGGGGLPHGGQGGAVNSTRRLSSLPTTETSSGTRKPA